MNKQQQSKILSSKFARSLLEDDLHKLEQRRKDVLIDIGEHAEKSLAGANARHHKKFIDSLTFELESIDFLKSFISSWRKNIHGEQGSSEERSMTFIFWNTYKTVMGDLR
jgi:hypothetical protein